MVSPQTEKQSRTFVERKNLSMELLSDTGNQVAEKYGLAFTLPDDLREVYMQFGIALPKYNGDDSWRLPMPARYIIDQERTVRYAEMGPDYTVRPDPSHTIEALRKLVE